MKNINWNEVPDPVELPRLGPGGYVCKITVAKDVPEKEYIPQAATIGNKASSKMYLILDFINSTLLFFYIKFSRRFPVLQRHLFSFHYVFPNTF